VRTEIAYSRAEAEKSSWKTAPGAGFPKRAGFHCGLTMKTSAADSFVNLNAQFSASHHEHSLHLFCCLTWVPLLDSAPMPAPQLDHRGKRRVRTKIRATVRAESRSILAETRDISTGGMFLYADSKFDVGSEIQIVLMLPRELGLVMDRMVCCHATVLRIEPPNAEGRHGIAATIDRFAMMNQV
jgi:hypothetical protein